MELPKSFSQPALFLALTLPMPNPQGPMVQHHSHLTRWEPFALINPLPIRTFPLSKYSLYALVEYIPCNFFKRNLLFVLVKV